MTQLQNLHSCYLPVRKLVFNKAKHFINFIANIPFLGAAIKYPFTLIKFVFKPNLVKPLVISQKEVVPYMAKMHSENSAQKSLIITLIIVSLFVFGYNYSTKISYYFGGSYIAKIVINEELKEQSVNSELFKKVISKAEKEKRISAVIVEIDSPGGTVYHSHKLYREIRKVAQNKPTVALVNGVAASGGYMIATACDKIFGSESSLVGSIGVIYAIMNYKNLLDKVGVRNFIYKSSILKAAPNPIEDTNEAINKEQMSHINSVMSLFKEIVQERRKLTNKEIDAVANGATYYGKEAVSKKLIDGIADEEQVIDLLVKNGFLARKMKVINISLKPKKQNGYSSASRGAVNMVINSFMRYFGAEIGLEEKNDKKQQTGAMLKYDPAAL